MMKKLLTVAIALTLLTVLMPCAMAEDQAPLLTETGWSYIGYIYGGITFAVPNDYVSFDLSASDTAEGYVLVGGNMDFTIQMRVFQPEELSYDDFKAIIEQESTAEVTTRTDNNSEILLYRNTRPNAYSELYGIAITGLDGLLYKISIFTGVDEVFGADAPVWAISETVGQTVRHQDFSEWGIGDEPDASSDDIEL